MDVDESMVRGLILVLLFVPIRENTSNPQSLHFLQQNPLKRKLEPYTGMIYNNIYMKNETAISSEKKE